MPAGLLRPAFSGVDPQSRTMRRADASTTTCDLRRQLAERRVATPWRTLLRARAIENLSYCVGLNRVGIDGNDLQYGGDSAALDFLGQPMIESVPRSKSSTVTLDRTMRSLRIANISLHGWTPTIPSRPRIIRRREFPRPTRRSDRVRLYSIPAR